MFLRQRKLGLCILALACLLHCSFAAAPAGAQPPERPVRIGMVGSLFKDINPIMIPIGSAMFAELMKSSTGMDGTMITGGDALSVGKDLHDGKLDLAVFHGVEFAWAQQRYPNLRPLMVAITKYKHTQAHIVVREGGPIDSFDKLKESAFALPMCSRAHCVLFLNHCCSECGQDCPDKFFSTVARSYEHAALDDVCLGKVEATVVDAVALERYEALKPGCFARLRILKPSEHFPTGVIAYRDGALQPKVLDKFCSGLLTADKTDLGKDLMRNFKITSFEAVPDNYAQMLADIIKVYPPPTVVAPR